MLSVKFKARYVRVLILFTNNVQLRINHNFHLQNDLITRLNEFKNNINNKRKQDLISTYTITTHM